MELVKFEQENEQGVICFDAGEKDAITPINAEFTLINITDHPVFIEAVLPSCSCTAPDFSKVIEVKNKGFIKLVVNLPNSKGNIIKSATVKINQGDTTYSKVIYVKAKQV